jgi:uncharacterized protein HtrL/YibB-like
MTDLTLVTGIWDLGRERAGRGFQRPFEHYKSKFAELLEVDVPMVVFGDEDLREFVFARREGRPTDFRVRPASHFRDHFDFYDRVQEIRTDQAWLSQTGWLSESTQASLELYNPMVMSKMFLLHDASIWNPFGTEHWAWIDGGITNTVHPGYFTRDRCLSKMARFLERFFFISFPYEDGAEVHGFDRGGMERYCGQQPTFVCRGGFFGGHIDCLSDVNEHYYEVLSSSLYEGLMGTEESIFTIMAYEEPTLYERYPLREEHSGLILHFFEHVKTLPAQNPPRDPAAARAGFRKVSPDTSMRTVAGYVLTFNAPDQLVAVLESWLAEFEFDHLYVLDNSTEEGARGENRLIMAEYGATALVHPNGNGGVCGGRQFVAEHFQDTDYDYCVFIEDDMFLNTSTEAGVCNNGLRLSIPNLRAVLLEIMEVEGYDFLKLSFTEFYGDNKTQFAWYNVPADFRRERWPENPHLPSRGLAPDSPSTKFDGIGMVRGVSYIDGEVYYCNWPHIVSKAGNRRMFLDTVFEHPFEQTWMSHMYQLTIEGALRPAVLLASIVTHDRFHHYSGALRKEN